jgi:hypothetical protein
VPRLIAFKTVQKMRWYCDKETKIRDRETEHLKMLGATHRSMKESEYQNSSVLNPNASATKNSFGMTQDPKLETKMSKVTERMTEK